MPNPKNAPDRSQGSRCGEGTPPVTLAAVWQLHVDQKVNFSASEMGRWVSFMTKKGSLQASVRDGCRGTVGRSWPELRQRRVLIVPEDICHVPAGHPPAAAEIREGHHSGRAARHEMGHACRASPIGLSPPSSRTPHPPIRQEPGRLPTSFICFISTGSGTPSPQEVSMSARTAEVFSGSALFFDPLPR